MRRVPVLLCVLGVLPCLACAPDETASTAEGDGSSGSAADASEDGQNDDEEGGTAADDDGAADGSSSGDTPAPEEQVPARGITLTTVYANQGVAVPIVVDGAWVDGSSRNAELIKGRNTLINAQWQLDPAFEPREIRAELRLIFEDGREEIATKDTWVEGESTPQNLDSNVWFVVPAELVEPAMRFQVQLYERGSGYENLPEPTNTAYPPEPGYLGVEPAEMVLRSVLVPVQHDLGADCPEVPVIDEVAVEAFSAQLYMQNPVERVEITVREPIVYTEGLTSFGGLLQTIANLRDADGADPGVYYYGLVRPCDGGPEGVGGQAISIPGFPTLDNGWARVAVGRWYNGSLSQTAGTYVHEIGHIQGRAHIACNGDEAGTDPSYPYDSGDIGVWGFGVLDFSLHSASSSKDYMTYCGNTWVSDWGWRKVVPYVREITSWDAQSVATTQPGRLLVGLVDPTAGTEHWFVTRGSATGRAANPADTLELEIDGELHRLPTTRGSMGDGDAYNVVVELPDTLDVRRISTATRLHGNARVAIDELALPTERLSLRR